MAAALTAATLRARLAAAVAAQPRPAPARRAALAAGIVLAAFAAADAQADAPLRDPMQPPARIAPAGASTAPAAAEAPAPLRLQMIVRHGESRRALLAGRTTVSVTDGDEFDTGAGRARVLRVTDASVFLAYADRRERLDLHPELRSATAGSRPRSGR